MALLGRRDFLKAAGLGGTLLFPGVTSQLLQGLVSAEASEPIREFKLEAAETSINLGGGKKFKAFTYNGQVPGPEIRVKEGDRVRVVLNNRLPEV